MKKTTWYIAPYKIRETIFSPVGGPVRYCAMDDYTQQIIYADGGKWSEIEILGDRAIVKVLAEEVTLIILNSVFKRIPKDRLDDSLSDLSTAIKTTLKNEILDQGYTIQEIKNSLGNDLGAKTLRDVLKFMASKKLHPRLQDGDIVFDGDFVSCNDVEVIDGKVML